MPNFSFLGSLEMAQNYFPGWVGGGINQEQAGAELGQAQVKLEVIVYIGEKVEVEIIVKVGIQLLAWVVGGWMDKKRQFNSS